MPTTVSEIVKQVKTSSTLALTARAKELKAQGKDIVSFSAGEPDFPTPENICRAGIRAIETGQTRYTAVGGTPELKKAICEKFEKFNKLHYEPGQIVVSNGGKHSLSNAFIAILNPGDEVIIPAPFWLTYPESVRLAGGTPVIVNCPPEEQYKLTAQRLRESVTPKTKALVLNNPGNPTGSVYTEKELRAIAEVAVEMDFFVISDEMYEVLTYDGKQHVSIATFNEEIYKRTITVCGVAKSFAMTGWRIGYTGSTAEIASLMSRVQSHQASNANSIAQAATVEALSGPQEALAVMCKAFDERRKYIYERVCAMPYVKTFCPEGAFYLFVNCADAYGKSYQSRTITSAAMMSEILLNDYLVAAVPCDDFGASDCMRFSYAASMEDIVKGMDRMEAFLKAIV